MGRPFSIQIAIIKSAICCRAVKAGHFFDILRNESASTNKLSEHQGPLVGPSLSECTWVLLTFVFEFEPGTFRASTGPALVQTLKKTGSRMPLRMKKAVLVRSNYNPRTFNPCGDVTVSYLL